MVINHARRLVAAHFRPGAPVLDNRQQLLEFVTLEIGPRDHEVFGLILLDSHHRLIDYVELYALSRALLACGKRQIPSPAFDPSNDAHECTNADRVCLKKRIAREIVGCRSRFVFRGWVLSSHFDFATLEGHTDKGEHDEITFYTRPAAASERR